MHLLNPLQAAKHFCSFHSVIPLPHSTYPKHSVKGNPICLRSLLSFRCIPFGWSLLASAPDPFTTLHLHSISHLSTKSKRAPAFHLSSVLNKTIFNSMHSHPCPLLHTSIILQSPTIRFFNRHYPYTQKIKKKANIGGLLKPTLMVCKVKMHF